MSGATMLVTVRYFAALRDAAGTEQEQLATAATDCAALWQEVAERHALKLPRDRVRVAIDDRFASWDQPLHAAACVCFMPPFAGG